MTDDTHVTDSQGATPGVNIEERLGILEDAIGTANRAARATQAELVNLRYAVLFAAVFVAALYIGSGGKARVSA